MLKNLFIVSQGKIVTLTAAFAGHVGDAGIAGPMPHEVLGGIAILAGIGLALIILAVVGIRLLVRIERHLRK